MRKDKSVFAPDSPAGKVLEDWWRALASKRGDRAELRRAQSAEEVALIPATIHLITSLCVTPVAEYRGWNKRIPLIAGLVARLDPNAEHAVLHDPTPLPERMAKAKGDRVLVSELRFRRLLRTPREELYRPMIRILTMLDHQANLFELAEAMFWWGPIVQKDWAFTYFPKLPKNA